MAMQSNGRYVYGRYDATNKTRTWSIYRRPYNTGCVRLWHGPKTTGWEHSDWTTPEFLRYRYYTKREVMTAAKNLHNNYREMYGPLVAAEIHWKENK